MSAEAVIDYIDRRLESMSRAPLMYGDPEHLELMGVLLLELRAVAMGKDATFLWDEWRVFCNEVYGGPESSPLSEKGFV